MSTSSSHEKKINKLKGETTELELKLDNHDNYLPQKQLYLAMLALSLITGPSTFDNSGTSIAVAYMAKDLDASQSIQWVGTSYGITLTVFTVLVGRFADLFGRKYVLLVSTLITGFFQLACALAQNGAQLYIFRALVGLGAAGSSSLGILIVTDLVPFDRRATYQGFMGIGLGIGDCAGPLINSGFIRHTQGSWRNYYYLMFPLNILATIIAYFYLPSSSSKLTLREIYQHADYPGFLLSSMFLVFLLLPLNCGGILWDWDDPKIIVFFVLSGVSLIAFIILEWKFTKLPTIPLRIFKFYGVSNGLIQCIFYGIVFQGMIFYLPYYYTIVREFDVTKTALMSLCYLMPLALNSYNAGKLISTTKHYNKVLISGYFLWFLGACLTMVYTLHTPIYASVLISIVSGIGIGFTFQPSVIAIQAQALKSDKSVVVTTRNVFRSLGNAIGTAIGSLIYTNKLKQQVNDAEFLDSFQKNYIIENLNSKINLSSVIKDPKVLLETKKLYMKSIRLVFVVWIPLLGACLIMSFLIKDRGLRSIDEFEPVPDDVKEDDSLERITQIESVNSEKLVERVGIVTSKGA